MSERASSFPDPQPLFCDCGRATRPLPAPRYFYCVECAEIIHFTRQGFDQNGDPIEGFYFIPEQDWGHRERAWIYGIQPAQFERYKTTATK